MQSDLCVPYAPSGQDAYVPRSSGHLYFCLKVNKMDLWTRARVVQNVDPKTQVTVLDTKKNVLVPSLRAVHKWPIDSGHLN